MRRYLRLYLPALHAAAQYDATGTAFYPAAVLAELLGFTEADARGALDTIAEDLELQGDDVPFPAGLLWRMH